MIRVGLPSFWERVIHLHLCIFGGYTVAWTLLNGLEIQNPKMALRDFSQQHNVLLDIIGIRTALFQAGRPHPPAANRANHRAIPPQLSLLPPASLSHRNPPRRSHSIR